MRSPTRPSTTSWTSSSVGSTPSSRSGPSTGCSTALQSGARCATPPPPLPDREAREALRLFCVDVHGFDARVRWPRVREGDDPFDRIGLTFEDGLDGSFRGVASPPGDTLLLGLPAQGVAEEDSLDIAVDHDPPAHAP